MSVIDDFVMFAMENDNSNNKKYARDFYESLRDREFIGGSNSALNGLMDYDAIYDSVIASGAMVNEEEADMIWSYGQRYFTATKGTLVS